jgi:RNase adapter protein RapZ
MFHRAGNFSLLVEKLSFWAGASMITLVSFGFKKQDIAQLKATSVVDVRILRNPHQHPGLRVLDGRDPQVQGYVRSDPVYPDIRNLILKAIRFNPVNAVVAIGCHGGKHRSVAVVEMIADKLRADGYSVACRHTNI